MSSLEGRRYFSDPFWWKSLSGSNKVTENREKYQRNIQRAIHSSSVNDSFLSPLPLFLNIIHFLIKQFLSKSFSVCVQIQCLTFIYSHYNFKSSLNPASMQNYCQQIWCILCKYYTPMHIYLAIFLRMSCWVSYKRINPSAYD